MISDGRCTGCQHTSTGSAAQCFIHGCRVCGSIILADTEDWAAPLCPAHAPNSFLDAAEVVFRAARKLLDSASAYGSLRTALDKALKGLGR